MSLRNFLAFIAVLAASTANAQSSASSSKAKLSLIAPTKITLTTPNEKVPSLSVKITDPSGHPIPGVTIEFFTDVVSCIPLDPTCKLPPDGMYGGFPAGIDYVLTDSAGVAATHHFSGGHVSGTYNVSAMLSLGDSSKNASLVDDGHDLWVKFAISQMLSSFTIQPATSGSWFDPRYPGQGFNLEVLDNSDTSDVLLAYFYTFDKSGNGLWLAGSGTVGGNTATVPMYKVDGGVFPPLFDPNKITPTKAGELKFQFSGCDDGEATWTPDASQASLGETQFTITRLTRIPGLECH